MKTNYLFPGTFSPPTYGHAALVSEAAQHLPHLTVVCSENPTKSASWFTPEEAVGLWQAYSLPRNVSITTLAAIRQEKLNPRSIVMVRGIRDESDVEAERGVMQYNREHFGITKFLYLHCAPEFADVSSSSARVAAEGLDFTTLAHLCSPLVVTKLLEHTLGIANLFLVVGKPGSGKSTLLTEFCSQYPEAVRITTDGFNHTLRPLLEAAFPGKELLAVAKDQEAALIAAIKEPWLALLREELLKCKGMSHVFVEAAYGLQPNKELFRLLGGKAIYVGCTTRRCTARNHKRGTPELLPFVPRIPGWAASKQIAQRHNLSLARVSTDTGLDQSIAQLEAILRR
ncbi:MAG TPA: adenylyltransferase/cytidyltransferase family protein [Verrucomicrobiae bacterium]|nr:adenylyltransferase/cytidyltransferase family protein [Verrucomicrobiae bacterium]